MRTLLEDLRSAVRGLRLRPGYALMVVATLALGLGAATAVFSLIDGVLLRPLPYPDAERLVVIRETNPHGEWNTSVADFQAIQARQKSFEAVAATRVYDVVMTGAAEPTWVTARWVTADYFRVLGVTPARGRGFRAGEDQPGAERTVVISHAFAERQFGAGVDPLGRSLTLDGSAYAVIGVLPPGLETLPAMRGDVWPTLQSAAPTRRGPFTLNTVARLKPGVSLEQARDDLAGISRALLAQWTVDFNDEQAKLMPRPLHAAVIGEAGGILWVAFGAVVVVLLIAVVNVANLVLMRVTERAQDLGVRAALGASRRRLARLLLSESVVLSLLGGLAGAVLAMGLLELYRALGPPVPRLSEIAIDWRVLLFTGGVALLAGLLVGTLPLLFDGVGKTAGAARGASAGRGQQLLRGSLVSLEFALALPLLIAAGLLIGSLMRLQRVDPGFPAENLLTARVKLPDTAYPDAAAQLALWERALPELRAIPGVRSVALANGTPPDNPWSQNNFDIIGRPAGAASQPVSAWQPVTDEYFDTLGVRLLEGRVFDATDTPESTLSLVVTRSWAARYFPGESAVGKGIIEGGNVENPTTIVGVVSDVKFDGLRNPGDVVFASVRQGWPNNPTYIHLRSAVDPLALVEPLRARLQRIDPALVPTEVTTMESRLRESLTDQRHWAAVIAGFALAAVLLASIGVFGVLAYYVSRQHREIGIRLSLGADAQRIVRMVMGRGVALAAIGTAVGVGLALVLTRSLESLLFEVGRADPLTLIGASLLLLSIALAACWVPARRAARVDPMVALRYE